MGIEWVLPDGEILRLGSVEAVNAWFSGDGPGFSLRGIMRGMAGAAGGLGVITKAALKLAPWYGPPKIETDVRPPTYLAEIPDSFSVHTFVFPSLEKLMDATYLIGEERIAYAYRRQGPLSMCHHMVSSNKEIVEDGQSSGTNTSMLYL